MDDRIRWGIGYDEIDGLEGVGYSFAWRSEADRGHGEMGGDGGGGGGGKNDRKVRRRSKWRERVSGTMDSGWMAEEGLD